MMPLVPILALAMLADPPPAPAPPAPSGPVDVIAAMEKAVTDAVAKAEASVVAIHRFKSEKEGETAAVRGRTPEAPARPPARIDPFMNIDVETADFRSFDYGSGVVVGENGEILTAYHVVIGAARLVVRAPGRQQFEAEILAADPRSDLAVIAPRRKPNARAPKLTPIALGDADALRKGSFLLALGNPFNAAGGTADPDAGLGLRGTRPAGDGRASASWGILSNVARRIEPPPDNLGEPVVRQLRHHPTLLQLDAKLNLGMSGGAVVNLRGELVGVTTTGGDPSGLDAQAGYAIPIDALGRRIVERLRQGKEFEYGFLGVSVDQVVSNKVNIVANGSPADLGNILHDDVIVGIGGVPIADFDGMILALSSMPVGKPVKFKVDRKGEVLEKTVTLSKYPVRGEVIATSRPDPWRGLRVDFTSVLGGAAQAGAVLDTMGKGGIGVLDVESDTPAEAAGLRKGQIITAVDGKSVRTPSDFAEAVAKARGPVKLDTDLGAVTIK